MRVTNPNSFGVTIGTSGSYRTCDVTFLLKEVFIAPIGIAKKEAAIQFGVRHYSEMISDEPRPDIRYMELFHQAWSQSRTRFAREVTGIGQRIRQMITDGVLPSEITLCSLVRAGVPLGVILKRELEDAGIDVVHFGISIIRDRGIDMNAMNHVMTVRDPAGIVFVDGWTGKGAIANELRKAWPAATGQKPFFVVLADPCGEADLSGSHDDWLIPTGILGANISGLISRSILNADVIGPGDFHGFIPVSHLSDIDQSSAFADDIHHEIKRIHATSESVVTPQLLGHDASLRDQLRLRASVCVKRVMDYAKTDNTNRVKPGIAEATRAVLRRKPEHVFVRSMTDPDVTALIHLCNENTIPYTVEPHMTGPYRAITLIGKA